MNKKAQEYCDENLDGQGNKGAQYACENTRRDRASVEMPQIGVFDSRAEFRNPTVLDNGVGRWNVFFEYIFQGRWLPDSCQSAPIMPPMEA
ncbi:MULTISPECIES: hypothetical protein [unclassified Ketobacter]|uniref:hypothetical protein n=1 Tax=unclassified Ketobacter TaxID=2639109 RepID=UPI0025C485CD|nr:MULTISPECIES: hypothetical protein [unclassified Ketobacter]MEC8809941.1 hypothetical protein [Pseudomonadota bacterium]